MFKRIWLLSAFLLLFVTHTVSAMEMRAPYNSAILEVLQEMPKGGGYDTSNSTFQSLKSSIFVQDHQLTFSMKNTVPSFCSSSTYLVFMKLIAKLQKEKKLSLRPEVMSSLLITGQADGVGVWGRWNANGPGTARLFYELGLGSNFMDLAKAEPGDFMKAFWSDEIGAKERGHSVVFTGTRDQGKKICFWSSNSASKDQPAGMGERCLAKKKFHRMVFSRLQSLESLNQIPGKMAAGDAQEKDPYLAALLERASSPEEMCAQIGCP
jgi:hypothetical protein